jgi:hypothetical protein
MTGNVSLIVGLIAAALISPLTAQDSAPMVRLTIEPAELTRGRTSIVTVRVEIPEGMFIPAETRGTLKGSWLQPVDSGFPSRELPTYPAPTLVALAGTNAPMLAYSGIMRIHLPVFAAPGMRGRRNFGVRFAHQLCDSVTCTSVNMAAANTMVEVGEPSPSAGALAFRVDASRVAILLDRRSRQRDEELPFALPVARFAMPIVKVPKGHPALLDFNRGEPGIALSWSIVSSQRRFRVEATEPAVLQSGCEETMPMALLARIGDASFAADRAKYFLAWPDDPTSANVAAPSPNGPLTDSQRRTLEGLLDQQMRITLPSVLAPDSQILSAGAQPKETEYDRRIARGEGRLSYHLESLQLAPYHLTRFYVRAYWAIGRRAQTGLTLWIRFDGQQFTVEQTDASVSRFARYAEAKVMGLDVAARPNYAGTLLNVIPASDGWSYLIMGSARYESFGVSLYKYSALGPQVTSLAYGHGC